LKRIWPFIFVQFWILFTQWWFVPVKFDWNWPAGSEEEDFSIY
jgi:hypothetical protein